MDEPRKLISLVGPIYQGSTHAEPFYQQASEALRELPYDYEIVLVDDGSTDDTFVRLLEIQRADPEHVRVVRLSRNFGHHAAATAALEKARGDYIFILDTDLQDDPRWINKFLETLEAEKLDMVYGFQSKRCGGFFERLFGMVFYWLFNKISDVPITPNSIFARVMTRRFVDALLQLRESDRFLAGLMHWVGFPQRAVEIQRVPRAYGKSTYSLARKINLALSAITSFSSAPLTWAMKLGFITTFLGLALALHFIVIKLFFPLSIGSGWTSIFSIILIVGGLNMFLTGMVGLYLSRTYAQVKHRPTYVIMTELDATERAALARKE